MSGSSTLRSWLRPGLVGLHLFAVAAIVFCVVMGLWQAGVYDSRKEHERADRQQVPRVALDSIWSPGESFEPRLNHRPVTVSGTFVDDQRWVGGKTQDGRTGYWLMTPLVVAGQEVALPVVRGWSPEPGALPDVPRGQVDLEAVLEPSDAADYAAPPGEPASVIGSIRISALINDLPYDLYDGYALSTTASASSGLDLPETPKPDVSWTTGLRNLAYAWQWWVFGLFAAVMWWQMARDSVARQRESLDPDPQGSRTVKEVLP